MNQVKVQIERLKENASIPVYKCIGDAGADVTAAIESAVEIQPGFRVLIPTGWRMQIPTGYEIQVRPRSGLALKSGITVLNTPGTIDSNYRGEVGIILFNTSSEVFKVNPGDRIAQLVVKPVVEAEFIEVDKVDMENDRGGGFGHTGV